jgi:phosphate transport system permease protein
MGLGHRLERMNGSDIEHPRPAAMAVPRLAQEPPAPPAATTALSSVATDVATQRLRGKGARLRARRPPLVERVVERFIHALAYSAVAAMILILIFIAKEAWPLLGSPEIHREVTLAKMWFIQQWPGYDAPGHVWQPVAEIPKYGVWPLLVGTLKVTLVAMMVAAPLALAAAVYVSQQS